MYQKVSNQTDSLKGLWAAKLNLSGNGGRATPDDMAKYDQKLRDLEAELQRRKELGHKYHIVMARVKELADNDEQAREDRQVRLY